MHRVSMYGFSILVMMAMVALAGCSGDDDPAGPSIPNALIGTWEQVYSDPDYYYMMTLRENGTGSYVAKYQGLVTNEGGFTYSATQDKSNGAITVNMGEGDVRSGYWIIYEGWLTIDFGDSEPVQFTRVVDP